MVRNLHREDFIKIKRWYVNTDVKMSEICAKYKKSKESVWAGLHRHFPKYDFVFEKARVAKEKLAKASEVREIDKLQLAGDIDKMDERHLELLNIVLTKAEEEINSGELKAKTMRDLKDLIDLERLIMGKRTSRDKIIVIKAMQPDKPELPEITDAVFEVAR